MSKEPTNIEIFEKLENLETSLEKMFVRLNVQVQSYLEEYTPDLFLIIEKLDKIMENMKTNHAEMKERIMNLSDSDLDLFFDLIDRVERLKNLVQQQKDDKPK